MKNFVFGEIEIYVIVFVFIIVFKYNRFYDGYNKCSYLI